MSYSINQIVSVLYPFGLILLRFRNADRIVGSNNQIYSSSLFPTYYSPSYEPLLEGFEIRGFGPTVDFLKAPEELCSRLRHLREHTYSSKQLESFATRRPAVELDIDMD